MKKLTLIFFTSLLLGAPLKDSANYLDEASRARVKHWMNRIEQEFGIGVVLETLPRYTGEDSRGLGQPFRPIDEDLIQWANQRALSIGPNSIYILVIKEGGFVVLSVGPSLIKNGEFLSEDRNPILYFLETHLAENKPSEALVGAVRLIYATLNNKVQWINPTSPPSFSNRKESTEWGPMIPWAAGTAALIIALLFYSIFNRRRLVTRSPMESV